MARRLKTIEYSFLTNSGTINPSTIYSFPSQTIYIPENNSRTFRSAYTEVIMRGASVAAASLTSWNIGISLTTASFNNTLTTSTVTNSGEHESFIFYKDATSYFQNNFGNGTSQICGLNVSFGTLSGSNVAAKLYITYEYDDTNQNTRIKTVKIPIESTLGQLTNTLTELSSTGGSQVPNINTFCPENSKNIRQMWFELLGNEASNAVTNFQVGVRLDSDTEVLRGTIQQALQSSCFYYDIWDVTNTLTTGSAHRFTARSTTTGRMSNFGAILNITYEYDHSLSTTVLNSVYLPFSNENGFVGSTTAVSGNTKIIPFNIQEPTPILLRQSGLVAFYNAGTTQTLQMSFGSQGGNGYVATQGSLTCGETSFIHRIDNTSSISLTRGMNYITSSWFTNVANNACAFDGLLILNYTSSIHENGDGVHNHTVNYLIKPTILNSINYITSQSQFNIPESHYYNNGIGFIMPTFSLTTANSYVLEAQIRPNEHKGNGYELINGKMILNDGENCLSHYIFNGSNLFERYTNDPDISQRINLKTPRQYKINNNVTSWYGLSSFLTYNSITCTITGVINNFSGSASGIQVSAFSLNSNELLLNLTATANGNFESPWFDDTLSIYLSARQNSTLMGRSDNGRPNT